MDKLHDAAAMRAPLPESRRALLIKTVGLVGLICRSRRTAPTCVSRQLPIFGKHLPHAPVPSCSSHQWRSTSARPANLPALCSHANPVPGAITVQWARRLWSAPRQFSYRSRIVRVDFHLHCGVGSSSTELLGDRNLALRVSNRLHKHFAHLVVTEKNHRSPSLLPNCLSIFLLSFIDSSIFHLNKTQWLLLLARYVLLPPYATPHLCPIPHPELMGMEPSRWKSSS